MASWPYWSSDPGSLPTVETTKDARIRCVPRCVVREWLQSFALEHPITAITRFVASH